MSLVKSNTKYYLNLFPNRHNLVTITIVLMLQESVVVEVVQEVSKDQLANKVVFHQQQRLQPTQLHLSHPIKLQVVATTIHRKRRMISQLDRLEPLATLRKDHQLELVLVDNLELVLVNHTQELKLQLEVDLIQELRELLVVLLTQQPANAQQDQPQEVNDHQASEEAHKAVSFHLNKDQLADQDSDQALVVAAAVDHQADLQANKMKAKKETTQLFPESPKSTTQFSQRFQKLPSIVTNKNSQDTTLMSRLVVKCSTSAL